MIYESHEYKKGKFLPEVSVFPGLFFTDLMGMEKYQSHKLLYEMTRLPNHITELIEISHF